MLGKLGSALNSAISKILRGGPPDKEVILELKNAMLKALLEADVQFDLAAHVVNEVERKSLDKDLAKGLSRKNSVLSIIHEELTTFLGSKFYPLTLHPDKPTIIELVVSLFTSVTSCNPNASTSLSKADSVDRVGAACIIVVVVLFPLSVASCKSNVDAANPVCPELAKSNPAKSG